MSADNLGDPNWQPPTPLAPARPSASSNVTLDFSQAVPLHKTAPPSGQKVTLDFSKARPIPSATKPAVGSMGARDPGVTSWLNDLEADLNQGGGRTAIGRALGHVQGRGDKGYAGLQSGVSPGVAQFMGSPIMGPIHAAQGAAQIPSHPLTGAAKVVGGALETATIPASFVAPEAGGSGRDIAAVVGLPTKTHAGQVLEGVTQAARNMPVQFKETAAALQEYTRLSKISGEMAQATSNLAKELEAVPPRRIDFPEARDFYSFITGEAEPKTFVQKLAGKGMSPKMLTQVQKVRAGLNSDLTATAARVNKAEEYVNALKEYRRAVQLQKAFWTAVGVGATTMAAQSPMAKRVISQFLPTKF